MKSISLSISIYFKHFTSPLGGVHRFSNWLTSFWMALRQIWKKKGNLKQVKVLA